MTSNVPNSIAIGATVPLQLNFAFSLIILSLRKRHVLTRRRTELVPFESDQTINRINEQRTHSNGTSSVLRWKLSMQPTPQQQIMGLISGYWISQSVHVAARLSLADLI